MLDSLDETDSRYAAAAQDLQWAQNVAPARSQYYALLGSAASSYNNSMTGALQAYNSTMLGAEIARASAQFAASQAYSISTYDIEGRYSLNQFDAAAEESLALLDAAIAEIDALADLEAEQARAIADALNELINPPEEEPEECEHGDEEECDCEPPPPRPPITIVNVRETIATLEAARSTLISTSQTNFRQEREAAEIFARKRSETKRNENYNEYFVGILEAETSYVTATLQAEITYISTCDLAANTLASIRSHEESIMNNAYKQASIEYYNAIDMAGSSSSPLLLFSGNQTESKSNNQDENKDNGTSDKPCIVCGNNGKCRVCGNGDEKIELPLVEYPTDSVLREYWSWALGMNYGVVVHEQNKLTNILSSHEVIQDVKMHARMYLFMFTGEGKITFLDEKGNVKQNFELDGKTVPPELEKIIFKELTEPNFDRNPIEEKNEASWPSFNFSKLTNLQKANTVISHGLTYIQGPIAEVEDSFWAAIGSFRYTYKPVSIDFENRVATFEFKAYNKVSNMSATFEKIPDRTLSVLHQIFRWRETFKF